MLVKKEPGPRQLWGVNGVSTSLRSDSGGSDGHLICIDSRLIARKHEVEKWKKKSQEIGMEGLRFAAPLSLSVSQACRFGEYVFLQKPHPGAWVSVKGCLHS